MALADLQAVLARLYTDKPFRESFLADPENACQSFDLTEGERKSLLAVDRTALNMFARSLIGKRLEGVRPLLPAIAALLGQRLRMLFERYCEQAPVLDDSHAEAAQFLLFLKQHGPDESEYLQDLLRAEAVRIELLSTPIEPASGSPDPLSARSRPLLTNRARLVDFDFDIAAIYTSHLKGSPTPCAYDPCCVLFGLRQDGSVLLRRLQPSAVQLIRSLDGMTPWGEIMRGLVGRLEVGLESRASFETECRSFVQVLTEAGLVEA